MTTFDLGLELDNRSIREPNTPGKFSSTSANIPYVQLGLPLMKTRKWGMNLGLRPITRINYKLEERGRLKDPISGIMIDSAQSLNEGIGGSYEVFGGTGVGFGNFSVGFNVGYLFGTNDYSTKIIFLNDSVFYHASNHETKTTFGGLSFNAGMQYSVKLAKTTWLRLGANGQVQRDFNANRDKIVQTFTYDANGAIFQIDSVYNENNVDGKLRYPSSYAFGFVLDKENKWLFGVDFNTSNWAHYRFYGQADQTRNTWLVKAGGQWTPDLLRRRTYWSHVTYRAGAYYGIDYVNFNKKDLPILGFTTGAALPIRKNPYTNQYTVINLGLEFGKRGNNENIVRENFFRIALGLSLSDLWFIKRKYD